MDLSEIEKADRADLTNQWCLVFGKPVPKGLSSPFLRRFIAFELQARAAGPLPKGFRKALAAASRRTKTPSAPALKPGGRLLREWNGTTHVVDAVEDGFLWNGVRYRSLSVIAREITGAHWSGPRFFGLKRRVGG